MGKKQKRQSPAKRMAPEAPQELPELPEGKPMPWEASPGGLEGVEPDWPGGRSNLGELLNPPFEAPAPYSTKDLPDDAPRVEVILEYTCDTCGQAFQTVALLNVHRRTAHKRR